MRWVLLGIAIAALNLQTFAQGAITFIGGVSNGSSVPNYVTGGSLAPISPNGSAAALRTRGFSGSSYFTSSGSMVDNSFTLLLGNGVNPVKAAGFSGVTVAPEPSILDLGEVAVVALLGWRRWRGSKRSSRTSNETQL